MVSNRNTQLPLHISPISEAEASQRGLWEPDNDNGALHVPGRCHRTCQLASDLGSHRDFPIDEHGRECIHTITHEDGFAADGGPRSLRVSIRAPYFNGYYGRNDYVNVRDLPRQGGPHLTDAWINFETADDPDAEHISTYMPVSVARVLALKIIRACNELDGLNRSFDTRA